jgi:hypothetical protein
MSVYDLPTQVTPIFNPLFWEVSDVSLTRQEADDLYLSIFGGQTVPQVESFASGIETNTVEPFGSANTVLNFTTTGNTNFGGNVNIPSGSFYKINNVNLIPSVSGQSGKYLGTDGSQTLWQTVDALPSQTGQSGRYLTTDGYRQVGGLLVRSLHQDRQGIFSSRDRMEALPPLRICFGVVGRIDSV